MTVFSNHSTKELLDFYIKQTARFKKERAILDEVKDEVQSRIDKGELESYRDMNKYVYDSLVITYFERTTWKYSPAVESLKEQEQFNGNATPASAITYRFAVKND